MHSVCELSCKAVCIMGGNCLVVVHPVVLGEWSTCVAVCLLFFVFDELWDFITVLFFFCVSSMFQCCLGVVLL